ncbi:TetR/AcrR family transcriptional regulator [Bacillus spongiae]|uniref:TetR/AcrR family transcriptional regulator n=1 Tax=Bacillus spongiae TaxID=2683610 RepID=A0ABU8HFN5_9BACI
MEATKRDAILEAALKLFANRNFDATTVPMIAESAKVGAGTIYRYFENKEGLLNVLFQKCITEFSEVITQSLSGSENNIRNKFHRIFNGLFTYTEERPEGVVFLSYQNHDLYLDEESRQMSQEFFEFLYHFIEEGKQEGVICELSPEVIISIVFGSFKEVYLNIRSGSIHYSKELIVDVENCCWNAIKR